MEWFVYRCDSSPWREIVAIIFAKVFFPSGALQNQVSSSGTKLSRGRCQRASRSLFNLLLYFRNDSTGQAGFSKEYNQFTLYYSFFQTQIQINCINTSAYLVIRTFCLVWQPLSWYLDDFCRVHPAFDICISCPCCRLITQTFLLSWLWDFLALICRESTWLQTKLC